MPSELIHPISCLSNKKPVLGDVENWYFDLEHCIHMVKEYNDFLRKNTNTRKYQLETVEEFLKKPLLYVPRKYIDDMTKLIAKLPPDDESKVYQFIGEDNIYFYAIAQTGLFTGLQIPNGDVPNMEKVHLSHIIANRHLLYMDTKASSSSELKPPMADELLDYYTKDQLRMHFMSLGLSSKSVGFKPQVFMKEENRIGVDMVLKDGNLITNVFHRLIRTCFYAIQNNCNGKIPKGDACEKIRLMAKKAVLDYERHMYNHEFHRISYILDDFIRSINKHWVNNVKIADATNDADFRKQLIIDCFYACKIMAILIPPIAPEGCDFFKKHDCQLMEM